MSVSRQLLLLHPEKQILQTFKKSSEIVIKESKAYLDCAPKLPEEETQDTDGYIDAELILSAEELLDCMVVIQKQLTDLKATYSHMKTYVQAVCARTDMKRIETDNAVGFLCSRTTFDQKNFKEENPEKYKDYIKQGAPFLVVKKK